MAKQAEALVIPGLVAIDPGRWEGSGPAEIVRGPLAGKARLPELSDWKRELWLLPREVAARYGVRNPADHPDLAQYPRLRARLAEAALVVAEGEAADRALAAGEPGIYLAYHRVSGGGELEVEDREQPRGFKATDQELLALARVSTTDGASVAMVYDRILRALTRGKLSLYDVDLADWAARVQASEFAAWEAELAEIEAMAAEKRPLAESLLAALEAAEADTVTLPGGYRARRRRARAFVLRDRDHGDFSVIGPPIEVPAEERWVVADVQAFNPPARVARRARAFAQVQAENRRAIWGPVILLVALLVGLFAFCVLTQG
ncbi:MAG TPA: hypothetical protein VIK91_12775 [Nannocystis sp.]